MGTIDRKIKRFEQIARADAIQIRNSLMNEIDEMISSAIEVAEKEYKKEAREFHVKEIEEAHKEAGYIMSTAQKSALNDILQKRNEIADNIFNELEQKLIDFTKTEEYRGYFERKLTEALEKAKNIVGDRDQEISILISGNDLKHINDRIIEEYFRKEKVKTEVCDENIIGGCIINIKELRLKINNTLRAVVDKEREVFLRDNDFSF